MSKKLTIVMYHYVRDIQNSDYPGIKGRELSDFNGQLDYLLKNYQPVTVDDILSEIAGTHTHFPDNGFLLTFDDGYRDHYDNVFPLLKQKGLQGCFFPPAEAILKRHALDVNKIHYILAKQPDSKILTKRLFDLLKTYRPNEILLSDDDYRAQFTVANRFDCAETILFKRLLQCELPETIRSEITDKIFTEVVGLSSTQFANNLYMTVEELQEMSRQGQCIGAHGHGHYWMNHLTKQAQMIEIDESMAFLKQVGVASNQLCYCYPYGAYNSETLQLLEQRQFKLGFTTQVGLASLTPETALTLNRLDTNDIPCALGLITY